FGIALDFSQGLIEIGYQVVYVFDADGKPQQVLHRAKVRRLDRGAMLNGAFGSSQAAGPLDEAKPLGGAQGLLAFSADEKRKQAAELLHLFFRDVVAGVRFKSGIKRSLHRAMRRQKFRDSKSIF